MRPRSSKPRKSSSGEDSPIQPFDRLRSPFVSGALFAGILGCSQESAPATPETVDAASPPKVELVVYAATSTRDALQALEAPYERDHEIHFVFNFGSSGDLSKQIIAAAKADVFLSADEKEMDKVERANLIATGSRRSLLSNQLVVVEPADAPSIFTTPFEPAQLAGARIQRLSLADVESVPAGRYAKAWLEKTGAWKDASDRVLPGVDVRAALAAVESSGAQAGIVYRTDAARSKKVRVVFTVPIDQGPKISYPIAAIAGRPADREARAFVEFLASSNGRSVFEEFGFAFLPAAPGSSK